MSCSRAACRGRPRSSSASAVPIPASTAASEERGLEALGQAGKRVRAVARGQVVLGAGDGDRGDDGDAERGADLEQATLRSIDDRRLRDVVER